MASEVGGGGIGIAVPVGGLVRGIVQAVRGSHKARAGRQLAAQLGAAQYAARNVAEAAAVAAQSMPGARVFPSPIPGGVLRAAPVGTVGTPGTNPAGTTPAPGRQPSIWESVLDAAVLTLDTLRQYGIHLPWDPRTPRPKGGLGISIPPLPELPPQVNTLSVADVGSGPLDLSALTNPPAQGAQPVANVWTGILQGAGELLSGALQGTAGPFGQFGSPGFGATGIVAQPGGALVPTTAPTNTLFGMGGAARGVRGPSFWSTTDPVGRAVIVRKAGSPIAWSGDVAAARRLKRAYHRIGKALPGMHRRSSGYGRRRRRGGY